MIGSGGMPSSHSATVMALAVSIALQEGVGGSSFAIALVFACIVCICQPGLVHILALTDAEDGPLAIINFICMQIMY